jgi:hypothetical protein
VVLGAAFMSDSTEPLLLRRLRDSEEALQRHTRAVERLEHLLCGSASGGRDDSSSSLRSHRWLVVAGSSRPSNCEPADPNPPRLWFDLTSFGADPTGRCDSAEALSTALAAASAGRGGATIYIPAGTYRLYPPAARPTGQLGGGSALQFGVHIRGDGVGRTVLEWVQPETPRQVGWQLLVAGAPSPPEQRWRLAREGAFPLAVETNNLVPPP